MNQSERRRCIEKNDLSTRTSVTIPQLACKYGVSENTIKADFIALETIGVAYCANPNGKPQLWFAVQPSNSLDMTLELAFALKYVNETVKSMLPDDIYQSIEHVFEAAQSIYHKKRNANHQSKVMRFERLTAQVDLSKHLALRHIDYDALNAVKSAISSGNQLLIEIDDCDHVLSDVSVFEMDNMLFLKGKSIGSTSKIEQFNASEITAAYEFDSLTNWRTATRCAA
ncbi:hypothetical protein PALB_20950 [Pseudoalteromonas luteoviolacea B = ATCC 29581]|nr:hypothetical protein PALB_20950 [Pseudoalteromonas luteoviolacea B = ATCC 29581]